MICGDIGKTGKSTYCQCELRVKILLSLYQVTVRKFLLTKALAFDNIHLISNAVKGNSKTVSA